MCRIKIFVEPRDFAIFDFADDRARQTHLYIVLDTPAGEDMLLDEPARVDRQATVGVATVLDPLDHTGQSLCCLGGADNQLVRIVPDFCVGREAVLHCFYIARFNRVEKVLSQLADINVFGQNGLSQS